MTRLLELAPGRYAHASGALWLPEPRTLLIADAHLGYGWAQRRRGELGPLVDGGIDRQLTDLATELAAASVVFLGDLVHAPRPAPAEFAEIARTLEAVARHAEVIVVRGNHDRAFWKDFASLGFAPLREWRHPGLLATHGDRLPPIAGEHLVIGHFHPSFAPRDSAGARRRMRVFLWNERTTVLPAFSPFAAGSDVARFWPADLGAALGSGPVRLAACTGSRIAELPFRRPA